MFSSKKEKQSKNSERQINSRNIIGEGTKFIGDVSSHGDFRIDGTLEGSLITNGRVIIGEKGFINGKIECDYADVEGKFSGELMVNNTLIVKSSANIVGDVTVGQISTEPGASFNATCSMKGTVKELGKQKNVSEKNQQTA